MPPVIDLEFGGNCPTDKSQEQIIKEIQSYLNKVEDHYGRTPVIYATKEFYDEYLQNRFVDNPIWIRDVFGRPDLIDERNWTFWQFANRGHLKGIDTYVDINVFNGTKQDFDKFKDGG